MLTLFLLIVFLLFTDIVLADIPTTMTTQQILRNVTTDALMTGTHIINYSLIRLSDNIVLWNESISVVLDSGIASVMLGLQTPIYYSYFINPVKWRLNIDSGVAIEYNETPYGTSRVSEFALSVNWTNISGKPSYLDIDSTDDVLVSWSNVSYDSELADLNDSIKSRADSEFFHSNKCFSQFIFLSNNLSLSEPLYIQ